MKLDHRYNLTLWLAFACIGALVLIVFIWQINRLHEEEWKLVENRLLRHHQAIEAVLRSCADELEALRAVALDPPHDSPSIWPSASGDGYDLDHVAQPDRWGNLIGTQPLASIGRSHRTDLQRALTLAPWLSAIPFKQPAVAESRYESPHGFVLIHPWRASGDMPKPFMTSPEPIDDDRRWGTAYFGGSDRGLLVPLSAPVRRPGQPASRVRLDLSLDHLNRLNNDLDVPLGVVWLINSHGQVLAHPRLYARGLTLQAAPHQIETTTQQTPSLDPAHWAWNQRVVIDGQWYFRMRFRAAPWQMLFVMDARAAWWRIWWQQAPVLAEVLVSMMLLMALAHFLTRKEFVQPALKLVQYLGHTSRNAHTRIPEVPQAWQPWFARVRDMLDESRKLLVVEQELRIAAQMQQAILPLDWPIDAHHSLTGVMRPARHVGGDFYDHLQTSSGGLSLIVADVSGKGVGAALFGMVCKTHYRSLVATHASDPARLLAGINQALCVSNPQCMFVTAWCGHYNPQTGWLRWSGAGHPPALLQRASGGFEWLKQEQGVALGLMDDERYASHEIQLHAGDQLWIYTDGVTEAINPSKEEFGTERFAGVITRGATGDVLKTLLRAIDEFAGNEEQFDDITTLILSCKQEHA